MATLGQAGRMAQAIKDREDNTDRPFYIDDNISVTLLTEKDGKKIMGFEGSWKGGSRVQFLRVKYGNILKAFKAMEEFFNKKK